MRLHNTNLPNKTAKVNTKYHSSQRRMQQRPRAAVTDVKDPKSWHLSHIEPDCSIQEPNPSTTSLPHSMNPAGRLMLSTTQQQRHSHKRPALYIPRSAIACKFRLHSYHRRNTAASARVTPRKIIGSGHHPCISTFHPCKVLVRNAPETLLPRVSSQPITIRTGKNWRLRSSYVISSSSHVDPCNSDTAWSWLCRSLGLLQDHVSL